MAFFSTSVVRAPKAWSVKAAPKAAPSPSCLNDDQQEDGNDQLGDENQVDTNVEEGGENHEWKSMEK